MAEINQKITTFLWFDKDTEEAINFYVDVFNGAPNKRSESKILSIKRYEGDMEVPEAAKMDGKILTAVFELEGQQFMALDGGPIFKFTEATSFYVDCQDQAEIDYFWEKLSAVPESEQCGWLKDKFGLSWQIVPRRLNELLNSSDKDKANAVTNCMLKMKKLDIAELEAAAK